MKGILLINRGKLGGIIKSARKAKGFTVEELASKIEISHSYVSLWETNRRVPSDEILIRLSVELGIDFDVLQQIAQETRFVRDRRKLRQKYGEEVLIQDITDKVD